VKARIRELESEAFQVQMETIFEIRANGAAHMRKVQNNGNSKMQNGIKAQRTTCIGDGHTKNRASDYYCKSNANKAAVLTAEKLYKGRYARLRQLRNHPSSLLKPETHATNRV
jgi:hypothetical protein